MASNEEILSSLENSEKIKSSIPKSLTVLPLRDIIIFPNMIFPVLIGRNQSLKAVAEAVERDKFIFVTVQKNPEIENPDFTDLYMHGTTARIMQVLRLPNNLLKVLIEGIYQSKIMKKVHKDEYLEAEIKEVNIIYKEGDKELEALIRRSSGLFGEYVKLNSKLPPDIIGAFENIEDPVRKLYYAAANVQANIEDRQRILSHRFLKKQYFELSALLSSELEMLKLEGEIDTKIHSTIQKTQKKFYIQEQIRALQKELGEDEEGTPELVSIKQAIEQAEMPEHVREKALEEFERLKKTPQMSPEYSVNRNYLELMSKLPWKKSTPDNLDINHVKKILDEDHYDLEKPKDRILEFIAVLNLAGTLKRQILCLAGPPGVGKTSLAKSIARALGREFVRFSLGGIRDEAEIRGHRRTYIGAMPGKIIQSMKKSGTVNPVILLDEIDKMSMDFRGDPSAALLEVLDPEQNVAFNDHYLEVDYDLSNVMFITTANVRYDIPLPLQDRMEIIELNSYLENEKIQIAKRHIVPRLLEEYGIDGLNVKFQDKALQKIIRLYTREAGVRNLEREIASILRKMIKEIVRDYTIGKKALKERRTALKENPQFKKYVKNKTFIIDDAKVEEYLKAPKFKERKELLEDKTGVATGLAWTSTGGEILPIEVTIMPGAEKLTLTGKLGDVMKESAMAALSYVRSSFDKLGIKENFNKGKEIHVHVPEGAIPKDGPSAGIAISMALISAATGKDLAGDVAMTGEITLRGNVLPIGGLKEKLLAAKRIGIKSVIIPKDNERDIEEIDQEIKDGLNIKPVESIDEALNITFRNWSANRVKVHTKK
ncbi:MAG: endopeptidase La [Bacteroidota bacterium]